MRPSIWALNHKKRDEWVKRQSHQVPAGSTLLDVCAGSAPYRSYFAHCAYKTHDFCALEPSQLLGKAGYAQIDYVSDATKIPVPDEFFDVVLFTEGLEHVPDPILVIKEIGRILKPGGKLILTAPLGSGLHQPPYHFYGGYTPWWYERFLHDAGFEPPTIEPNGGFFLQFAEWHINAIRLFKPWRTRGPITSRALWMVLWLMLLPWSLVILPLLYRVLDRLDHERAFTIGYHVMAIKRKLNK